MFTLVSKIQNSLQKNDQSKSEFKFTKERAEILKVLKTSLEKGRVVGIYSRFLGEGMFLAGISDIVHDGITNVISLETYDLCGHLLNRTKLLAEEIKMVCPFESAYINPLIGQR